MTLSQAQVERHIRRLDDDMQAIYEMLAAIRGTQQRHGNRLDEIDVRLEHLDAKVDGLDAKVSGLDGKLDTVLALLGHRPGS